LLDESSTYAASTHAWKLRLEIFRAAARSHPLVTSRDRLFDATEQSVKDTIAAARGTSWPTIESDLYADVLDRQRLLAFQVPDASNLLLSRYNVAQLQACLYRARGMTITATTDFKTVIRHVKLLHLLHEIRRTEGTDEYTIELTGPASQILSTRRYGVQFARMIPPLLACSGWRMRAELGTPWGGSATLSLSPEDGFVGHLATPAEFDSSVEAHFAKSFSERRDGWQLIHEGAILQKHQRTFVPDSLFRHDDGTEVLMEIVGYWTPEYLESKRETLRAFPEHQFLLAVQADSLRTTELPAHVVSYKTAIKVPKIVAALEAMRINAQNKRAE